MVAYFLHLLAGLAGWVWAMLLLVSKIMLIDRQSHGFNCRHFEIVFNRFHNHCGGFFISCILVAFAIGIGAHVRPGSPRRGESRATRRLTLPGSPCGTKLDALRNRPELRHSGSGRSLWDYDLLSPMSPKPGHSRTGMCLCSSVLITSPID